VAVLIGVTGDICDHVSIALGSVAPTALRAKTAEGLFKATLITAEMADGAAGMAIAEARPMDDIRGRAEFRSETVILLTRQGRIQAVQDAQPFRECHTAATCGMGNSIHRNR
jgi:CO/xanthine dehydrogenase FAD-binding subunit